MAGNTLYRTSDRRQVAVGAGWNQIVPRTPDHQASRLPGQGRIAPPAAGRRKQRCRVKLKMDLQSLIEHYGYAGILIGTFLEGETILVLAGLAAHQGYLALTWVILAAFLGSLCGDQLFFYLGRKHSQAVLSRRPGWKQKAEKVHQMMNRFQTPMILSFRFLYGLRTVAPFVIGMSSVPVKKFILLNGADNYFNIRPVACQVQI